MDVLTRDETIAVLEDHASRQQHTGKMDQPNARALGYNPACGDRYEVFIRLIDGRLNEVRYHGFGCVISKASASMMARSLEGHSEENALALIDGVRAAVMEGAELPGGVDNDISVLMGAREHPSRIKCVLLPWQSAFAALSGTETATTETATTL